MASSVQALAASDIVIDVDLLGKNGAARSGIELELERLGMPADLSDCRPPTASTQHDASEENQRELTKAISALRKTGNTLLLPFDRADMANKLRFVSDANAALLSEVVA